MKRTLIKTRLLPAILICISCLICAAARSQEQATLDVVSSKDAAHIYVWAIPKDGVSGFVVYRAEKGSSDFKLITENPIRELRDQKDGLELIGMDEAAEFLKNLEVETYEQIFVDARQKRSMYNLFSIFSPELNMILGRLYIDRAVEPGAEYSYKIALVDDSGKEIEKLDETSVKIEALHVDSPVGYEIKAEDSIVTLTWEKPGENFSGIGWDIYRSTDKAGVFEKQNKSVISILGNQDQDKKSFFDTMLVNGTTYYYYIVGVDMVGNMSEKTEILEATPRDLTPPMPPNNVKVELKERKLIITWDVNLEPDMAFYDVYVGDAQDGNYEKINSESLPPDMTEYIVEKMNEGKLNYFKMSATDKAGNVSKMSVAVSIVPPDVTPPDSPIHVEGKPGGKNMVLITWEKNQAIDLHGYYLYRGETKENLEKINTAVIDKELIKYEDFTVHSGQTYYYALAALDESLNVSEMSVPIEVIAPDAIPPAFPASLFAQPDDFKVHLNWTPNQEKDLDGYRLYRADVVMGEDGKEIESQFLKVGDDLKKEVVNTTDETVINGKVYKYYLTAFDDFNNESERSSIVIAKPRDDEPPEPPSGIVAEPTEQEITITWNRNPETDIAGYTVLRSNLKTGVYEKITADELSPETTVFKDDNVEKAVEYWYRIKASDTSDNESLRSDAEGPFKLIEPEPEPDNEEGSETEKEEK
ncbi:MAG TPA: hypothetical protein PLN69_00830 [bacterium]|nr:hypothetical protein [bacterium]